MWVQARLQAGLMKVGGDVHGRMGEALGLSRLSLFLNVTVCARSHCMLEEHATASAVKRDPKMHVHI
jgi:hypothetical protein